MSRPAHQGEKIFRGANFTLSDHAGQAVEEYEKFGGGGALHRAVLSEKMADPAHSCERSQGKPLGSSEFLHLLQRTHLHSNAGWFGLKDGFFTGKGVDALTRLASRLLYRGDLHHARDSKLTN